MFQGLRTVVYHVDDLEEAKAWYGAAFETEAYFDEAFYVGFNIGGFELGLLPNGAAGRGGVVAYWGVADADAALKHVLQLGATANQGVEDVGEGIRVATVLDPFGNLLGIIENPFFKLEDVR